MLEKKENQEKKINDLVYMLDDMFKKGHGHINVYTDESSDVDTVETSGCIECSNGNLSCSIPNLYEGLDGQNI